MSFFVPFFMINNLEARNLILLHDLYELRAQVSFRLSVCDHFSASVSVFLTFIRPCVANMCLEYNQQDATFHNLFVSVRRSTCFRWFFRPSSGAQNCTYSVRYLSDRYCYLLLAARLAAGSSIGLTNTWRCMCSFELLMMDGNPVWNM